LPDSSTAFAGAFVLRPEPSRLLGVWWIAVHTIAVTGILASGLILPLKLSALAGVLVHGVLRRRPPPKKVIRRADGIWSMAELGHGRLRLCDGTSVGPFWILLRFRGAGRGRPLSVLLLRDQLSGEAWRALQAELRRTKPVGTV